MFRKVLFFAVSVLLMFSCTNSNNETTKSATLDVDLETSDMSLELSENAEEDVIFYNLLYPTDLRVMLDKKGSFYNSKLLNPLNNISNYQDSKQMALALGVYGADLSYLWIFEQSQQALSYLTAIKQMAYELGVPQNEIKRSGVKAENYADNIDSLVYLARQSYHKSDEYLQSTGQQELAVLILLGGWVESLHTAINLYTEPNERMALKILSQKYSLASLINLLNQNEQSEDLAKYNQDLFVLLTEFDELQNRYLTDQLYVDSVQKSITFRTQGNLKINSDEFDKLKNLIVEFRSSLIN